MFSELRISANKNKLRSETVSRFRGGRRICRWIIVEQWSIDATFALHFQRFSLSFIGDAARKRVWGRKSGAVVRPLCTVVKPCFAPFCSAKVHRYKDAVCGKRGKTPTCMLLLWFIADMERVTVWNSRSEIIVFVENDWAGPGEVLCPRSPVSSFL